MKNKLYILFSLCLLATGAYAVELTRDQYYLIVRDVFRFGLTEQETVNRVAFSALRQNINITNSEAKQIAAGFPSNNDDDNIYERNAMLAPSSIEDFARVVQRQYSIQYHARNDQYWAEFAEVSYRDTIDGLNYRMDLILAASMGSAEAAFKNAIKGKYIVIKAGTSEEEVIPIPDPLT